MALKTDPMKESARHQPRGGCAATAPPLRRPRLLRHPRGAGKLVRARP